MSDRPAHLLLEDIQDATGKVHRYTADMTYDAFVADEKTVDAVARNLEIIGEAASRLPAEFRAAHPEIEWRKIVGLRNRIVHRYFGLDLQIVWTILLRDLPEFSDRIAALARGAVDT